MALCLGWACSGEQDPIQALLDEVEEAVEERSAEAVGVHLAQGFQGSRGIQREEALSTLRRYLAGYQSVSVELYQIQIERAETAHSSSRCASGAP